MTLDLEFSFSKQTAFSSITRDPLTFPPGEICSGAPAELPERRPSGSSEEPVIKPQEAMTNMHSHYLPKRLYVSCGLEFQPDVWLRTIGSLL